MSRKKIEIGVHKSRCGEFLDEYASEFFGIGAITSGGYITYRPHFQSSDPSRVHPEHPRGGEAGTAERCSGADGPLLGGIMSRYETRQEVANKAEYEGGWHDFLFGYGFDARDCPDYETRAAFEVVERLSGPFHLALDRFTDMFPEPGEGDDE